MNVALIGYGKMGHVIEQVALRRGHRIVVAIDKDNLVDFESDAFRKADVAIEFTTPQTALYNILHAWQYNIPVVCGTTGWQAELPQLQKKLQDNGQALLWSSNFSIGVNLLFEMNRHLSQLMSRYPDYKPHLKEVHHIHKLDAPSGTAVTMAEQIGYPLGEIESIREGEVPGIHEISYESAADCLTLRHEAKSREGFALGAVLAAEFLQGKKGFFTMQDVMNSEK